MPFHVVIRRAILLSAPCGASSPPHLLTPAISEARTGLTYSVEAALQGRAWKQLGAGCVGGRVTRKLRAKPRRAPPPFAPFAASHKAPCVDELLLSLEATKVVSRAALLRTPCENGPRLAVTPVKLARCRVARRQATGTTPPKSPCKFGVIGCRLYSVRPGI